MEYALYKGEELIAMGTIEELAVKQGVTVRTMYFYTMPAYQRRCPRGNGMQLVKLDD